MSAFNDQVELSMQTKSELTFDDVLRFIESVYDFVIPEGKEPGEHAFNILDCYEMEELGAFVKQAAAELAEMQAAIEAARDYAEWLDGWVKAYPLDIFPEPDLYKARELLQAGGMTLDVISASNFRHILSRIQDRNTAILAALAEVK